MKSPLEFNKVARRKLTDTCRCKVCNQVLTAEKSVEHGIGPDCMKMLIKKAKAWDEMYEDHLPEDGDEDNEEDWELREKMERYIS